MRKDKFCKLLSRIWLRGKQKQPIDRIMSVRRYELRASLIESLLTSGTGWRGKKDGSILQNENCNYFESQKACMQRVEMYQS